MLPFLMMTKTLQLNVVEDICLEKSTTNYNSLQWLIVGRNIQYPKKRSLLRFEDIPDAYEIIEQAKMCLYYAYSHKASWHTGTEAPFITRTIQAHRVLKSWKETEATSKIRYSGCLWNKPYLGLDDTDAHRCPTGETEISYETPSGFVEIDVTSAVKDWKAGEPNYGLLIWAINEDENGRDTRFFSKSYGDSSKHAYIAVNYMSTQ